MWLCLILIVADCDGEGAVLLESGVLGTETPHLHHRLPLHSHQGSGRGHWHQEGVLVDEEDAGHDGVLPAEDEGGHHGLPQVEDVEGALVLDGEEPAGE